MSGIVVIGGGVVGAAATYHLARHGHAVTLIDRSDPDAAAPLTKAWATTTDRASRVARSARMKFVP